jgi:hypothetical protein
VEQREKLRTVILYIYSYKILNSEINLERAAFGEILMLTWGELL